MRITLNSAAALSLGAITLLSTSAIFADGVLLDTMGNGSRFQIGREITFSAPLGYDAYPQSGDFTGMRPAYADGGVSAFGTTGVPVGQTWVKTGAGKVEPVTGAYAAWLIQPFTPSESGTVTGVQFVAQIKATAGYNQGTGRTAFVDILEAPADGLQIPGSLWSAASPVGVSLAQARLGSLVTAAGLSRTVSAGKRYWLVFAPQNTLGSWNPDGLDYANLNWAWKSQVNDSAKTEDVLYNNTNGAGDFVRLPGRVLGVRLLGAILPPADKSVGDARQAEDGTYVRLNAVVISGKTGAVGPGFFYVEAPDRSSGIRVIGTVPYNTGDSITVTGTMTTVGLERALLLGSVASAPDSGGIVPVKMLNRAVAGEGVGLVSGKTGGVGLNNVGLLVTIYGKAARKSDTEYAVSDGSLPGGTLVKVPAGVTIPEQGRVQVTGIVSLQSRGNENVPIILVRSAGDVLADE